MLHLDGPRLTAHAAASVLQFWLTSGWPPPVNLWMTLGAPPDVMPIVVGNSATLQIDGIVPSTKCFVQIDLRTVALRWARAEFISLHAISCISKRGSDLRSPQIVSEEEPRTPSSPMRRAVEERSRQFSEFSKRARSLIAHNDTLQHIDITFSDRCGISRRLQLRMAGDKATAWTDGFTVLHQIIPRIASPAHWRWVIQCMAATSKQGATGTLSRAELPSLLTRVNASPRVSSNALAVLEIIIDQERMELPQWRRAVPPGGPKRQDLLSAPQVAGTLLTFCTSSPKIRKLFEDYGENSRMHLDDWLTFTRSEQLQRCENATESSRSSDDGDQLKDDQAAALALARTHFEDAIDTMSDASATDKALSLLHFSLELLSPHNRAALGKPASEKDLREPFAHYWTAASHNSCERRIRRDHDCPQSMPA